MFEAIRISGGLFSSDEVRKVQSGKEEGQRAADYDEPGKLDVRINEDFRRLQQAWEGQFKVQAAVGDDAERVTFDSWLRYVLGALGFGSLRPGSGLRIGDTKYGIKYAWNDIPIHIVSHDVGLEDKTPGVGRNPHSTLQEYLTRSDVTWGIVTNGRQWRILRDNATHTRPSFLEFDLEAIMEGGLYDEFVVFWNFSHATRFPDEPGWLETWMKNGQRQGTRAVERLREQVRIAIEALGQGFIRNPKNHRLRVALDEGKLSEQEYFHELLRLVYRLLFVLVTEARDLLLWKKEGQSEDAFKLARRAYEEHYSMQRLRRVGEKITGTKHHDLFEALKVVMDGLKDASGRPQLALPPLNSDLWSPKFIPHLEASVIENHYFLDAIRALNAVKTEYGPQRIDYANLGAEELGSVYEGLLEVKPVVDVGKNRFRIEATGGGERRTTGSHYTPTDLIDKVLDHALDPLLDEAEEKGQTPQEQEKNLLELTVCDPTCGSGHFLIAAAHRIARRVATHRFGEPEPTPGHLRNALRDVIQRCIYGVDINPMSVELCKVSLWLEAMEPGKPLAFLDHHIKCGNALLGAFPEYLERGIPDEAYKPRPGIDNPEVCKELKAINKKVPMNQETLKHFKEDRKRIQDYLAQTLEKIEAMPTNTVQQIEAKEEAYRTMYLETHEYERYKLALDAWCAAFSYPKVALGSDANIGNPELLDLLRPDVDVSVILRQAIAAEHQAQNFFCWRLEFPNVAAAGGFYAVIGNPPYLGGNKVSGILGHHYNAFLLASWPDYRTRADLAAAFILRASTISRAQLGMITTNTISKGETRETGLAKLVQEGWTIRMAWPDVEWPGEASVIVALIALSRGAGTRRLKGQEVPMISSRLDSMPEAEIRSIAHMEGRMFRGDTPAGSGFIIDSGQVREWVVADPSLGEVLFPYMTAEDLLQSPSQSASRWIICFRDWDSQRAAKYHLAYEHAEREVKPTREGKSGYGEWWQFGRYRGKLREATRGMKHVIVQPRVSETPLFIRLPNDIIFSDRLHVLAADDWHQVGVLNSCIHEVWYRKQGTGLKQDSTYIPTKCYDTFPVPNESPEVARLGEAFHETVLAHAKTRGIALTPLWNLVNDPECHDLDIEEIRRLRNELTVAVAEAFEMPAIEFEFGFFKDHAERDRYTMSPAAQERVYLELVRLNGEQAAAEKLNGASKKGGKSGAKLARGQAKLFGERQVRL